MNKADIMLTVARYVINEDIDILKGEMGRPRFFKYGEACSGERSLSDSVILEGYAVDILAEGIEKGKFFGWMVSEDMGQACNPNNARLIPLRRGITLIVQDYEATESGLLVRAPLVPEKAYLKSLKDPESFKRYADLVDLRSGFGKKQKTQKQILNAIDDLFS